MTTDNRAPPVAFSYIRMSTNVQLKGHSRLRQLEKSAAYAKDQGLNLANESQLEDIGVSAFKGDNVTGGALGQFLDAVERGRVQRGSYLLVESLDRISRQELLESLELFLRIVKAGINLVTLQDLHVYRAGLDLPDLIISLSIMARAHEESKLKSERVAAAWANKRARANSHPITKLCPAWLRLNQDLKGFDVIKERAAVVRSIFADAVMGMGAYAITSRLNQKRIPPFGKSKGWQRSYVAKIMKNRAVIGEYQPCKMTPEGRREPIGDPKCNYFPPVIDEAMFYRAQHCLSERQVGGRGRKGKNVTNLFSGLTKCAYCHSRMFFENKGSSPKGGSYLVCEAARRGLECPPTRWRYEQFEASFLAFVKEVELPRLIHDSDTAGKDFDQAMQALEGRESLLRDEMEKAYALLKISPIKFVAEKLDSLEQQVREVEQQLTSKKLERQNLLVVENAFYESKEEIKSLICRIQQPSEGDDLYRLRSQVAAQIRALVREVEIAPAGSRPIMEREIKRLESLNANAATRKLLLQGLKATEDRRYFSVTFKDGSRQGLWPAKDDALELDARHDST